MARLRTLAAAAVLASVAALLLAGCLPKRPAEVTSAWPIADSERVVPRPPEPVDAGRSAGSWRPTPRRSRKRPLSVKIENSPAARPQTGSELGRRRLRVGGRGRHHALQRHLPEQGAQDRRPGAKRSAVRSLDRAAVPRAVRLLGGELPGQQPRSSGPSCPNLSQDAGVSAPYSRSSSRSAPHNLYLNTTKAYAEAAKRGMAVTDDVPATAVLVRGSRRERPRRSRACHDPVLARQQGHVDVQASGEALLPRQRRQEAHRRRDRQADRRRTTSSSCGRSTARAAETSSGSTTYDINLGGTRTGHGVPRRPALDGTWTADNTAPPRFIDTDGTSDQAGARQHVVPGRSRST